MRLAFEGKRVIVTGGASGIGEATSRLFVERGARVAILGRDAEKGRRVEGATDGVLYTFPTDVEEQVLFRGRV